MAIYTRTGDEGDTSLAGGTRVSKADPRVEAFGTIDEANSAIGLALVAATDDTLRSLLTFAQQRLYTCAGRAATPVELRAADAPDIEEEDIATIERAIDLFDGKSPVIRGFVLPQGSELAARLHVARTVVRRAERRVVAAGLSDASDRRAVRFLNRLSDLMFAAARATVSADGTQEALWDADAPRPEI